MSSLREGVKPSLNFRIYLERMMSMSKAIIDDTFLLEWQLQRIHHKEDKLAYAEIAPLHH